MEKPHLNILDALRRVQGFLDSQVAALGALVSAALRAVLDDTVTQLAAFQVEQAAAAGTARGETANQATLRQDFYARFMRPIAHNARASQRDVGEFPTLVVSSSKLRKGDFLGAAQALADAATKYEAQLLKHGMAPDFLVQMRAAIAQMTASADARNRHIGRRQAATEGINKMSAVGQNVLVNLDSIIAPALKQNTPLLADWKASKRVMGSTPLPPQPTGLPSADDTAPESDSQAATSAA